MKPAGSHCGKPHGVDPAAWARLLVRVKLACRRVARDQRRINAGEPIDARISAKYA